MTQLLLYGTSACHLCELAEQLLANILANGHDWQIELIDIAEDDGLITRYGELIPVLSRAIDGAELHWPFNEIEVMAFVGGEGSA
ncbi:MAG: glutaredoxin family protein [Spongiibacteraceae bacterium]